MTLFALPLSTGRVVVSALTIRTTGKEPNGHEGTSCTRSGELSWLFFYNTNCWKRSKVMKIILAFRHTGMMIVLVLLLAALITAGCGNKKTGGRETAGNQNEIGSFTIADTTGDWGFPAPYSHYARGPGYVRMSFIFDTLVWKNNLDDYIPALARSWMTGGTDSIPAFPTG